jgi:hypothetical protein
VVALKLLQRDTARLGRLRRELQAARKVTHPNVVRIFDLVELPGELGLSMEYVEGETLARRLEGKGLLEKEAVVSLAKDLAHALGAAHVAGVTHRDLKPANVILREGAGGAAVTDFGIARMDGPTDPTPASADPGTASARLTFRGAIVGTPLYMAPEQLEGRTDIGPAADIYAFGLVVREAATGERLDANVPSLAQLREARAGRRLPPLGSLRRDLPSALTRVVDRCLAERPEQRYAHGTELARAVDAATAGIGSPWGRRLAIGLVVAIGVGGLVSWKAQPLLRKAPPRRFGMHVANVHRISFGECEESPSFTPDGTKVVYDGAAGADYAMYVLDLAGGGVRQLTHIEGWDYAPSVSPDGRSVAFLRSQRESQATYVVPLDGAAPPRFVAEGNLHPTWSRDGSIWAGDRKRPSRFDPKTGERRESLALGPDLSLGMIQESANGVRLGFAITAAATSGWGIVVLDKGGKAENLMLGELTNGLVPTPDGTHALVATRALEGTELVGVALDGSGTVSLARTEIHPTGGMALSSDGRRLAWSTCGRRSGLLRLDDSGLMPVFPDTDWTDEDFAVIPKSHSVVMLSPRTGRRVPWVLDLDGKAPDRAIPFDAADPIGVDVSNDGWVALTLRREGLGLIPLDGSGSLRRLTSDPSDVWPSFRHSGREVIFTRQIGEHAQVMTVPRAGGAAEPLLPPDTRLGVASSIDDRVAYLGGATQDARTPFLFDPVTGTHRPLSPELPPSRWWGMAFSADGSRVALELGERDLVEVEVATGIVKRRTKIDGELGSISYEGNALLLLRARYFGHLLLGDVDFN